MHARNHICQQCYTLNYKKKPHIGIEAGPDVTFSKSAHPNEPSDSLRTTNGKCLTAFFFLCLSLAKVNVGHLWESMQRQMACEGVALVRHSPAHHSRTYGHKQHENQSANGRKTGRDTVHVARDTKPEPGPRNVSPRRLALAPVPMSIPKLISAPAVSRA